MARLRKQYEQMQKDHTITGFRADGTPMRSALRLSDGGGMSGDGFDGSGFRGLGGSGLGGSVFDQLDGTRTEQLLVHPPK
jgi:hypothetical protein